ncbi:MAG: RAD55 family ATPase [Candidatus Jordarchaeum sp.]|uniref:RAD55 family ATPase n=1 Tax=Candidatus Jordarchaeum sp. TaxID=2823881 RepID=UPI004049A194
MPESEKDNRVQIGIQGLDELLDHGLRPGSLCIIVGEPLCGKEILVKEFFYKGLEGGESGIYITTNNFAEDIYNEMGEFGWDLSKYGKGEKVAYKIIDAYSQTVNPNVEDTSTVLYVPAATDLAGLSSKIVEAITTLTGNFEKLRVVLDSLSSIITFINPSAAIRFLSFLKARIRIVKGVFISLLESELTEKTIMVQILQLADVIMEIQGNEIHVRHRGKASTKGEFKIIGKGIEITPTK